MIIRPLLMSNVMCTQNFTEKTPPVLGNPCGRIALVCRSMSKGLGGPRDYAIFGRVFSPGD